jgi:hypothetical protein
LINNGNTGGRFYAALFKTLIMKNLIIEMVLSMSGHNPVYFEDALTVKKSPHTPPINLWAVCVSPQNEILLMDNVQQWHLLEESDANYFLVIASLHARMKVISKKTA